MMQFKCKDCGGKRWTVHGKALPGHGPKLKEIRCVDCGNREDV